MAGAEKRSGVKGFGPVWGPQSRALILGSYPSPRSFDEGFYYGHPQNRFWPLLAALCGAPRPGSLEEKTRLVLEHGLALWDSLESCTILGASDSSIEDPVPNDIPALMANSQIEAVFCNGAASHRIYRRYCEEKTGIPALCLPSTSPANAAFGLPRLQAAWAPLCAYISPAEGETL